MLDGGKLGTLLRRRAALPLIVLTETCLKVFKPFEHFKTLGPANQVTVFIAMTIKVD